MDPNTLVLEISSDEEDGYDYNHIDKGIIDDEDDFTWIADILDEVNRDTNCRYDDDSDEVVVVSEVLAKKPRKKLTSKPSALLDLDDDCLVLDHDPHKPPEPRNDKPKSKPIDRDEDDSDDSDDVLVVSEKGQIACRDYPHPRHLCIKFPFSSTPNQSHCDQCYCYVCDSLAPCIYWGNGSGCIDHCLATDKDDFWILERKNSKNVVKDVSVPPMNMIQQAQTEETPPTSVHNQIPRPNPIRACPVAPSFSVLNIVNQDQRQLVSRNRFHPGLVSQQLTRTSSCTVPRGRVHHSYNLSTPVNRPVFKRTASDGFAPTANQFSYNSLYRGSYRNRLTESPHPNHLNFQPFEFSTIDNTCVPFSPRSNAPVDFQSNFQLLEFPDTDVEVPVLFQPNPVPVSLSSQGQMKSSLPNYALPSGQESRRLKVDPKLFHSWPQSEIPVAQSSAPASGTGTRGLVDYEYDNWMFNNPASEPRSMDALVLREFD